MTDRTHEQRCERWRQAAILAACLILHALFIFWTLHPRPRPTPVTALQVVFLTETRASREALAPPPFPIAPKRVPRPATAPSRPMRSAPADTPRATPQDDPTLPTPTTQVALPTTGQLLQAVEDAARAQVLDAMPARRDPTQRRAAVVPGRAEPFTPTAIVLRKEMSPADLVRMIGRLLGGNDDPCPDTRSKIIDLVRRNEVVGEDELRVLIDRERRRCR